MPEPTTKEVERILEVYDGYRAIAERKWSAGNPGNVAMLAERNAQVTRMLSAAALLPIAGRRILDIGCGSGELLRFMGSLGAHETDLFGVDLLPERIVAARTLLPGATLTAGNAEQLGFPAASFDLVTLFTVFSSILNGRMSTNLAREICRVLRPGGHVLIYDFRVPSIANRNTRAVSRAYLRELFPGAAVSVSSLTVVPPLARRFGPLTRVIYPACARLPFLRTHNLVLLRPVTDSFHR
jgi:ubiquinone/menaquinone biosynthesis C-methylase UbiE